MTKQVTVLKRKIDTDIEKVKSMLNDALADVDKLKITGVTIVMVSDDGDVYAYSEVAKQISHIGGLEMAKHRILSS